MDTPSVLIVDDEDELRDFIASFLKDAGFHTRTAADGTLALEALSQHAFDAMILDLQMPRLDGLGVLERVRADPVFVYLGVLILSGDDQRQSVERGLELGADDYLLKPFSAWELEARLRGVIGGIRRRRAATAKRHAPCG